ncbi:MAG: hypothetical protein ABI621_18025 [Chloroflexota bacterium]
METRDEFMRSGKFECGTTSSCTRDVLALIKQFAVLLFLFFFSHEYP